ncbi:MAG: isoprenylcysteine carboxylmethyltransferase family protein [Burkholderiales bacterium]|nr:isoprenylcysteine carboxylmethyltransferase family protein [Burkholderiales bacterium]
MSALELKIPPPVVALLCIGLMALIAHWSPDVDLPLRWRLIAAIPLAIIGVATSMSGARLFRHAATTVNPMKPENTSSLVDTGIYRYTRNPMYLGILLVLCAWLIFLASPWAASGVIGFQRYITRYQILPEEKILAGLFGSSYADYLSKVRRWL